MVLFVQTILAYLLFLCSISNRNEWLKLDP